MLTLYLSLIPVSLLSTLHSSKYTMTWSEYYVELKLDNGMEGLDCARSGLRSKDIVPSKYMVSF
ncbi:hypothetical protein M758_1G186500 [Ceratodon purpureus]|uniref:Uncharacterized protein n=1 Tax=Ceratodon purpureus TaxID=3225 RepID=A0A8T0JAW9_CERPU|nr:hypothetical protein KC19_1G236900 [Ceratodon purpureus]KAG0630547.1 hypothetical protein M758_1G186500 [Ceratodon purpureus]